MAALHRFRLSLFFAWLGVSLACSGPVLVPTAMPLPIPSPTWALLPQQTPTASATAVPDAVPTATPPDPASPTATDTETAFSCPNAPVPRVQVGDAARVTFTDGLPLRIREMPEVADDNVITQITEGAAFVITGGPVCASIPDGETAFVFWEIEIEAVGLTGWVAEGDDSAYYIEVIP